MYQMKSMIAEAILSALADAGGALTAAELSEALEYPPNPEMGDLAFPCFKLSRTLRKAPPAIAEELKSRFSCECVEKTVTVGGYLNFFLSGDYLSKTLLPGILENPDYGSLHTGVTADGRQKKVVLDYSSPNICKPFHIGHLGTTVIGHSLKKLHAFEGYDCFGINYLGDWGTQFGKLITAYRLWGSDEEVEKGGIDYLVELYVRFHAEAEKNPSLNDTARAEFHKLETGDEENTALWKRFKEISLAEYERTYKQLDMTFDSYLGESFYTDKMPAQVEKLRELGLLKIDDGASIVDLEPYGMPPCLILKRDGSTLYPTRDIAAAVYRKENYHFDKCIYVTAAAQSLHFKQWFKVVELMGYPWYDELVHVPYGMVSVEGVKLSTRHGNMLLLRDVFNAAIEKVKGIMQEKSPDLEDPDATAEAVGVGAIVFHYLSGGRIKDMSFNLEDALSFDGNTGPYAQYTYARCCSILKKAGTASAKIAPDPLAATVSVPEEAALLKVLSLFPERVQAAIREYEPSVITRYILELCQAFNRFYHACPIHGAGDEGVTAFRLALTAGTKQILGRALELICMRHPEKI